MLARLLRRIVGSSQTGGFSFGLILLAYQLMSKVGIHRIRPVTGAAIALQVSIFLGWVRFGSMGPLTAMGGSHTRPSEVCLDAASVLKGSSQYRR